MILIQDLDIADPSLDAALDAAVPTRSRGSDQQAADGSFDGGTATEGPNANSTGLAGHALDLIGQHEAAEQAATWLRGRQVAGLHCEGKLSEETGAIAYDNAAYNAGAANGIKVATAGQWDFATIQALPALAVAPASETGEIALGRIPAFLDGGGRQLVVVRGLAPGEARVRQHRSQLPARRRRQRRHRPRADPGAGPFRAYPDHGRRGRPGDRGSPARSSCPRRSCPST